ncbi:hypothetical protein J6590_057073 [Homalodisca vitripennis]|nr:hypothetical protein J6590_057073 [Homalodisca vitripennis]
MLIDNTADVNGHIIRLHYVTVEDSTPLRVSLLTGLYLTVPHGTPTTSDQCLGTLWVSKSGTSILLREMTVGFGGYRSLRRIVLREHDEISSLYSSSWISAGGGISCHSGKAEKMFTGLR